MRQPAKKDPKREELLPIEVGDRVRDCDPRSKGRIKKVLYVGISRVQLGNERDFGVKSNVNRKRIHNNPDKKSGYYLLPAQKR